MQDQTPMGLNSSLQSPQHPILMGSMVRETDEYHISFQQLIIAVFLFSSHLRGSHQRQIHRTAD
jgi:hypothetical protein